MVDRGRHTRSSTRLLAGALAGLALTLALVGCGLGAGSAPKSVALTVTREFGARTVKSSTTPKVVGQETVMSLLERNDKVATSDGGGFVTSIDGLSNSEASPPTDWFYYVNGLQAAKGAAATDLHAGDRVWWDLHDWSQAQSTPAVVGSFPEPFLAGTEGKRWPVAVECSQTTSRACKTIVARLRALGVPAAIAGVTASYEPEILRVMVAPWRALAGIPEVHQLTVGPRASGVYARLSAGPNTLALLDEDGQTVRTLSSDAGLVAAVRSGEEAPVWVVTGLDRAGLQLAARAFDEHALHDHFAVAVTPTATIPLPAGP